MACVARSRPERGSTEANRSKARWADIDKTGSDFVDAGPASEFSFPRSRGSATPGSGDRQCRLNSRSVSRTFCLIADVQMPGVTGLDLHQRLSASGKPIPPRSLSAGRAEGCRSATASRIAQARERQVMALLVAGRVNKQIAAEIGISEVTVRLHRGQIIRKMRAGSWPIWCEPRTRSKFDWGLRPRRSQPIA